MHLFTLVVKNHSNTSRLATWGISVLAGFLSLGATAFANLEMRANLEDLHFDIPESCEELVEKAPRYSERYEQPKQCTEDQLKNTQAISGTVYRVVDGDTIHFYVGSSLYGIRMLGIDTPELHITGKAQPKWGEIAKKSLQGMVGPGDKIRVELDKTKCDKYGRILGHVFKGFVNLNREQVKSSMAVNYCIAPNLKYCAEYANEVRSNETFRRGIFNDKCFVTPYVWRKALQGQTMSRPVENIRTGVRMKAEDYYKVPLADRVFY